MGEKRTYFPGRNTLGYSLLELAAICGELPAGLVCRIPGSGSYKETVLCSLRKGGLLRTYYQDRLRGYRLGRKAKGYLLAGCPGRFGFYLTGKTDTNRLKCEVSRRVRLHRIAEVYVAMMNAGVAVFRDEKPAVFAGSRVQAPGMERAWILKGVKLLLEAAAIGTEAFCYRMASRDIQNPWLFSLLANSLSYFTGNLIAKNR